MKTILFAFLLLANSVFSQSILDHFKINKIEKVEVSYSPTFEENPKESKIVKSTTDNILIQRLKMNLANLPCRGIGF